MMILREASPASSSCPIMRRPAPRFGTQKCGSGEGGPEMVTFICKFCCKCNEKVPRQDGTSFRGSQICPDERPDGARRDGELQALQWQQHQQEHPDERPDCANCNEHRCFYNGNNANSSHKQQIGEISKDCFRRQAHGKAPQQQRTHF